MRTLRTWIFCLLPLIAWCAGAGAANGLYDGEVAVTDEGSETRNAALSELLAAVLVRVSGNPLIAGQPAARELLAAAPSLVEQYRYRTAEQGGEVLRYLWARFDQPVVERMMRERSMPVWTQRPRVLLWLATERGGQRSLLNLESEPEARAALLGRARQRGLPLQLPLMDLEDQAQLTPADVWSDYQAAIRSASARYPHDQILTGRLLAQRDGRWSGTWSLLGRDSGQAFQTPAQPLDAALAFAVDQAQNLLAARYAPVAGSGGGDGTVVRFSDVHDLAGYGRLVGLLDGIQTVAGVALRHVLGNSFTFELQLRGPRAALIQGLEGSGLVAAEQPPLRGIPASPVTGGGGLTEPEADLHYRLLN